METEALTKCEHFCVEPISLMSKFCPNCGAKMDGGADNG